MRRDAFASDRQVTMSWEPPAPSDAPLLGYVVTAYDGYYPELVVTFNSTRTTQTIGGLTNGVTYRFKVAAFNAVGTGDSSRVSNPVVPGS
jgi:titin